MKVSVLNWRPIERRNMVAFCDVVLEDFGILLSDIRVFQNEDSCWVYMQCRRMETEDGLLWKPYFSFLDKELNAKMVIAIERAVFTYLEAAE
jgi:DNA-binding cell septation regulator SpoVG